MQENQKQVILRSGSDRAFDIALAVICGLIFISVLYPLYFVVLASFSDPIQVAGGKVWFWPVEFNPEGWKYVLQRTSFLNSMGNSVIITLLGTVLSVFVTILTAYSLSRPYLKGRKVVIYLYVFMMIFNAGILPNYFQIKGYGLLNTRWALILPMVVSPYNTFVLKSNFESVPDSLEEAARIDGASFTRILSSVIIPVSKAGIATIVIFTAVSYWNRYFDALMYITKQRLKPAALLLYEFIKLSTMEEGMGEPELAALVSPDIKNASIVVLTVIPILAIYPFMQRYFVKGVMVGSVKG